VGRGAFRTATSAAELVAALSIEVDTAGLDRGLAAARAQTQQSLNAMGGFADRFSRQSRFAFQNASFQVADFVTQVSGGTSALRAFAIQAPQLAGAFGPIGAAIGLVVGVVASLGAAFLQTGSDAESAAATFDSLDEAIKRITSDSEDAARQAAELGEAYAGATDRAREFLQAQANVDVQRAQSQLEERRAAAAGVFRPGALPVEQQIGSLLGAELGGIAEPIESPIVQQVGALFEQLRTGDVTITKFLDSLQTLGQQLGPEAAKALQQLGDEAVTAAGGILESEEALRRAQERQQQIQGLAEKGVGPLGEAFGPPEPGAAAGTTAAGRASGASPNARRQVQAAIDALERADQQRQRSAQQRIEETARLEEQRGVEAKRKLLEAMQEVERASRELQAAEQERIDAVAAREEEAIEARRARETEAREEEIAAMEQRASRIEAGGRLPDEIDIANDAAATLSQTLLDLENLTFDSLLASLASLGQSLAQQVVQALLFRAIMSAIGGIGGGAGGLAAGQVTAIPGRAGGGPVTAGRPYWVGEFGRELMVPSMSGRVVPEGQVGRGGGAAQQINIDARQSQPGVEANIINMIRRYAPTAVVNAEARGQTGRRTPF
jgi:hypothetical protein